MELSTISRKDIKKVQEIVEVDIVPMSGKAVLKANKYPYIRQVVLSGDLKKPAQFVVSSYALMETLPNEEEPGQYVIGAGDKLLSYTKETSISNVIQPVGESRPKEIVVGDRGSIYILEIGKFFCLNWNENKINSLRINSYCY